MPRDHRGSRRKSQSSCPSPPAPTAAGSPYSSPSRRRPLPPPCEPLSFTVEHFPDNAATKEESGLPWGLVVSPLATLKSDEIRRYNRKNRPLKLADVPRCYSCYGYISGYCLVRARYWECCLCGASNVMEADNFLYRIYDPDIETLSVGEPAGSVYECEIPLSWRGGTPENRKGSSLQCHQPLSERPPLFLFLIQVASPSSFCPTITTAIIRQALSGVPSGARVAIWAFDQGTLATFDLRSARRPQVHLFHTTSKDSLPNLMQFDEWGHNVDGGSVVDLILDTLPTDAILCPMPEEAQAREAFSSDAADRVMKLLPTLFRNPRRPSSSTATDLLAALSVIGGLVAHSGEFTIGARVTAVLSGVGDWEGGGMAKRYRDLGRWIGTMGIGVGVCGVGTALQLSHLVDMVGLTSGEMWDIPASRNQVDPEQEVEGYDKTLAQVAQWAGGDALRSFDGILRLRSSATIGLEDGDGVYGLGMAHPRLPSIHLLASCHPEQSLAMDFKFANVTGLGEQHSYSQLPLVQMVYAYTTMEQKQAEWVVSRYLRVVTVRARKVTTVPAVVQSSANSPAILFLLFHKIVSGCLGQNSRCIRQGFIHWLAEALSAHHRQAGDLPDGNYDALSQLRYHIYRLNLFCSGLGPRDKTEGKDDNQASCLLTALGLCPRALERWVCPHVLYLTKDKAKRKSPATLSDWHPLPPSLQLVGGMGIPSADAYLIEGYDRLVLYYPASGLKVGHEGREEAREWVEGRVGMARRVEVEVVEYEAGDGRQGEWEGMLVEDRGEDFRGFCHEVAKLVQPLQD